MHSAGCGAPPATRRNTSPLFGGTCLLVWGKHRRALRAGGLGFVGFWRECWQEMRGVLKIMDPRGYRRADPLPDPEQEAI